MIMPNFVHLVFLSPFLALMLVLLQKDKSSNSKRLKLIIDVATRWNSTYDMVERFRLLHAAVYGTSAKFNVCYPP